MATIFEVYQNAKRTAENARGVVVGIIEDHADIIADYNRAQLESGLDRNGDVINPFYGSIYYAMMKNNMNSKPGLGVPDLKLTGAFYRGIFLSMKGYAFSLSSSNSKTESLVDKYGEYIFGLNDNSLASYSQNEFFEAFKEFIESTLKIKMT